MCPVVVVPTHHTAQEYVDAYLEAARIGEDRRGLLFRSCEPGRRDALQERGMSRMGVKRRARKAGLPAEIYPKKTRTGRGGPGPDGSSGWISGSDSKRGGELEERMTADTR